MLCRLKTDATIRTIAILTAAREDAIPPRAPRIQLMKIAKITATPVNVPLNITLVGASRPAAMSGCLVEIETDAGLVGHGFTSDHRRRRDRTYHR